MNILKDNEIVTIIKKYIQHQNTNYAILLNGDWGSGKTHFIKKNIIENFPYNLELEDKINLDDVMYLSLNGISSTDEINSKIIGQLLQKKYLMDLLEKKDSILERIKKTENKKKENNNTSTLVIESSKALLTGYIKTKESNVRIDSTQLTKSLSTFLFIFDDLERCNLDCSEVFGYINNFVEHDNIKTIIITNETEINKLQLNKNKELKYLVALSHYHNFESNLNSTDSSEDESVNSLTALSSKPKEDSLPNPYLKKTTEDIFMNDFIYNKIKEKVVGYTINYSPDLDTIIKTLISDANLNNYTRDVCTKHLKYICNTLVEEKSKNLRTFKFFLNTLDNIFTEIKDANSFKNFDEILEHLMKYTLLISIHFKMGLKLPAFNNKTNQFEVSIFTNNQFYTHLVGFNFINVYVSTHFLDVNAMDNTLINFDQYLTSRGYTNKELTKLNSKWSTLEDDEVNNLIKVINTKLEVNSIIHIDYLDIINRFMQLRDIGFTAINLENITDTMCQNISKNTDSIKMDFNQFNYGINTANRNEFNQYSTKLKKAYNDINTSNLRQDLEELFTDPNDISGLVCFVENKKNLFIEQNGFLKFISIELITTYIKETSNMNIQKLREIFNYIYSPNVLSQFRSSDEFTYIDQLTDELIDYIDTENKIIKKQQISWLIEYFTKILENPNH